MILFVYRNKVCSNKLIDSFNFIYDHKPKKSKLLQLCLLGFEFLHRKLFLKIKMFYIILIKSK